MRHLESGCEEIRKEQEAAAQIAGVAEREVYMSRKLVILLIFVSASTIGIDGQTAQKEKTGYVDKAIQRAELAGNLLTKATASTDKGISKELIDSARAIAVFPRVVKAKLVIQQITSGYGVVSRRLSDGWSCPAYYSFRGIGYDLNIAGGDSFDVILLFMNDGVIDLFQKNSFDLKGNARAVAGPIGVLTSEQLKEIKGKNIIGYALNDEDVIGKGVNSNFLHGFKIRADDNLNKEVYMTKGKDILWGKQLKKEALLEGLDSFQKVLRTITSQ